MGHGELLTAPEAAQSLLEESTAVLQVAVLGADADLVAAAGEAPVELLELARRCASGLLTDPPGHTGAVFTMIETPHGVALLWVLDVDLAVAGLCAPGANVVLTRRALEPAVARVAPTIDPAVRTHPRGRRRRPPVDALVRPSEVSGAHDDPEESDVPRTTLAQQMIMDVMRDQLGPDTRG